MNSSAFVFLAVCACACVAQQLRVEVLSKPGKCDIESAPGDKIRVHYVGRLTSGEIFDQRLVPLHLGPWLCWLAVPCSGPPHDRCSADLFVDVLTRASVCRCSYVCFVCFVCMATYLTCALIYISI